MAWEFLAPQSSQKSTDDDADGAAFAVFPEEEEVGGSFLNTVADVEVPGNDGVKTAIEGVVMKAFVTSEYLDETAGVEGIKGGLELGTRDW